MDNGVRDGRSNWLVAPPPSWAVPPERLVLSINRCSLTSTRNRSYNFSMQGSHLVYAATQGINMITHLWRLTCLLLAVHLLAEIDLRYIPAVLVEIDLGTICWVLVRGDWLQNCLLRACEKRLTGELPAVRLWEEIDWRTACVRLCEEIDWRTACSALVRGDWLENCLRALVRGDWLENCLRALVRGDWLENCLRWRMLCFDDGEDHWAWVIIYMARNSAKNS